MNTLNTQLFVMQHPSPDELCQAAARDRGRRLIPIIPKNFRGKTARATPMFITPADYCLELAAEPSRAPRSQVLPIGSLLLEDDGGLIVKTRDGWRFKERKVYSGTLPPPDVVLQASR